MDNSTLVYLHTLEVGLKFSTKLYSKLEYEPCTTHTEYLSIAGNTQEHDTVSVDDQRERLHYIEVNLHSSTFQLYFLGWNNITQTDR